jgi:hypothetical protein
VSLPPVPCYGFGDPTWAARARREPPVANVQQMRLRQRVVRGSSEGDPNPSIDFSVRNVEWKEGEQIMNVPLYDAVGLNIYREVRASTRTRQKPPLPRPTGAHEQPCPLHVLTGPCCASLTRRFSPASHAMPLLAIHRS